MAKNKKIEQKSRNKENVKKYLRQLEIIKYLIFPLFFAFLFINNSNATMVSLNIMSQLNYIKNVLNQVGPALSAILFIIAGIFYAIGQLLPPDKKANFHTTAINIIIGAVVVAILSVASTSFATASTHLLSNFTTNSISNVS